MTSGLADIVALAIVVIGALAWVLSRGGLLGALRLAAEPEDVLARRRVLAGSTGAATIAGTVAAVGLGGPGAVVWLWVGMLALAPLWVIEARRAPLSKAVFQHANRLASVAVGVVVVGVLAGRTLFELAPAELGISVWPAALVLAAVGVGIAVKPVVAQRLVASAPALVGLFVGLCLFWLVDAGMLVTSYEAVRDGATDFMASQGLALGAVLAVVVHHGLAHAALVLPGGAGLVERSAAGRPRAIVGALVGTFAVSGVTALVLATAGVDPEADRLDDPEFRTAEIAQMLPLERAHARAFLPSPRGQAVVLPLDTPLEADHEYELIFRANPRGYHIGAGSPARNAVAVPLTEFTAGAHTLVFRDRKREKDPSWDWRIEATTEVLDIGGGKKVLQMTPADPSLVLSELAEKLDGPYVVIDDPIVTGRTARATAPTKSIGDHLAFNGLVTEHGFDLERLVRMGVRGPYYDVERPRAPLVFVGKPDLHTRYAVGDRVMTRFVGPERGLPVARLLKNGELETPAWRSLEDVRLVRMRHDHDPALDFFIPVTPYDENGALRITQGRLRFSDAASAELTMHQAALQPGFTGPFLEVAPFTVELEVRTAAQLADPARTALPDRGKQVAWPDERRVLVPVGLPTEARGGDGTLRDPHPAELLNVGASGPQVFVEGPAAFTAALGSVWSGVAVLILVLLTLASLTVWTEVVGSGFALALALCLGVFVASPSLLTAAAIVATVGAGVRVLGAVLGGRVRPGA